MALTLVITSRRSELSQEIPRNPNSSRQRQLRKSSGQKIGVVDKSQPISANAGVQRRRLHLAPNSMFLVSGYKAAQVRTPVSDYGDNDYWFKNPPD